MLTQLLQDYWLSKTEAQSYLTVLELGAAPVSSIARRSWENRVTVYSALKNLVKKWLATGIVKNKTTYYSVISPKELLQKMENQHSVFKNSLPEFMAIANKFDNKPQVQFFEWLEGLKNIYEVIIARGWDDMEKGEPYLTFTWTGKVDPRFQEYLMNEFVPWRSKFPRKTKSILAEQTGNKYIKYHVENYETLIIKDPIFDFSDEIVVYGKDKVAIVMYNTNEMCGLVITSNTLHNCLKSMFNLIRKINKKGKSK